jgi:5'(3')-deoxyribonucleotidase
MRILVDVDDTLAEFTPAFLELIADIVGKQYKAEDFDTWLLDAGFPEDVRTAIWDRVDNSPGFIRNLPMIRGANEALTELRQLGTTVALTAPHLGPHWFYERAMWLKERGFKRSTMGFMAPKEYVRANVFIDDNPEHINSWKAEHPEGLALLFDRPNTKKYTTIGIRVHSWDEAIDHILSFQCDRVKTK